MPHQKYPQNIKSFARNMRNEPTRAEYKLWGKLRGSQLGVKFRRQHNIDGKYIADFACLEPKIIIEIDGVTHSSNEELLYDQIREEYLKQSGFEVLRFYNVDIFYNIDGVVDFISKRIWELQTAKLTRPLRAGREL